MKVRVKIPELTIKTREGFRVYYRGQEIELPKDEAERLRKAGAVEIVVKEITHETKGGKK